MKRFLTILLALTISASCILVVDAAKSVSELKQELEANQKKSEQTKKEIKEKQSEMKSFSAESDALDAEILALQTDIDTVQTVIDEKDAEIQAKNAEIEYLNEESRKTKERLKKRMKVIYENGMTSYLEMIFEANGIADLFTRISVVEAIVKHDNGIIDDYNGQVQLIEEAKTIVETEKKEQVEAREILEGKQNIIKQKQAEKERVISELTKDINALKKLEKEMEQAERSIQNQINAALNTSSQKSLVYTGSGKFHFPLASYTRISSPYGYRNHPIYGTKKFHAGIDYASPYGTAIYAADDGKVLTSGWINGYGYTVSINHGSGYVTMYAHCSSLLVSAGQSVKRGQTIAKVGSTGNSTGNHLHFEVRVNGKTVDPASFL